MHTLGHPLRDAFPLDPGLTYLNHGTVGVAPRLVLDALAAKHREIERDPAGFLGHVHAHLAEALGPVADFVGTTPARLAFVDNATTGANAVLQSLDLRGATVLITDHGYPGVNHAVRRAAQAAGARVEVIALPFPVAEAELLVEALRPALERGAALLVLDHLCAGSGLLLPLAPMIALAHDHGVPVLVDGAHAPGQVPLHLDALNADWYTANLHKWAFAPRATGFLWAAPGRERGLRHPVASLFEDDDLPGAGWRPTTAWQQRFHWVGTRDPAPWLCAPAGLAFGASLGWARLWAYQADLAAQTAAILADAWGEAPPVPAALRAALVTARLPARWPGDGAGVDAALAHFRAHGLVVGVFPHGGALWARVSAQAYVEPDDVRRLAEAALAPLTAPRG